MFGLPCLILVDDLGIGGGVHATIWLSRKCLLNVYKKHVFESLKMLGALHLISQDHLLE
jgi:hypothetical protein